MFAPNPNTDDLARVAWLYHVGQMSQEDVSQALGISRFKVLRMLAEARDRGIVRVSVQHEISETLTLADRLKQVWGMTEVMVAPMPAGLPPGAETSDFARRAVGILAAGFLKRIGRGGQAVTIGMGWGWTLAAMARAVADLHNPNLRFVSLMGSMTQTSDSSPFDVCTNLAALTGGSAMFLPAPFMADDEDACRLILSQRLVRETLAVAQQADYAIVSVGECQPGALLFSSSVLTAEDRSELQMAGAVADTTGRFFRADGTLADTRLNHRAPAIAYDDLRRCDVVLLCAGTEKLVATRAVLRAGFVRRLIIDQKLAESLISSEGAQ
ncbi:transcriptional regulator [Pseudotabrizicola sediminis]|uniref:Transcriptional regulator n=1 Tax=Pseudotabrizicola sediminis TaxID=2486418 RepID=A0ABY2KIP5_9RHOB|nr:sugar-binding domain-containing protein [Pseudotabrizicola sediminis]TGD41759.1 transcriptional regulator [Pseudotabrizicola sediminis]